MNFEEEEEEEEIERLAKAHRMDASAQDARADQIYQKGLENLEEAVSISKNPLEPDVVPSPNPPAGC
ncbi:hypothetical protein ART_3421 [Arthrobacter sp. PAMC 25486]|uniref:hypothetical protein n=1 Tax=Arthrobacter sp. PAMC 25486 TaxID=1494608 RepID=UPI000535BC74|nr:hypothetical protein [Arthrobacter sp. PAMC 25486]AIY03020.1 hypothetical protein ART_3421 [Arthrobacter sp. PAMC 25486]